jgi:hypothetical protein
MGAKVGEKPKYMHWRSFVGLVEKYCEADDRRGELSVKALSSWLERH